MQQGDPCFQNRVLGWRRGRQNVVGAGFNDGTGDCDLEMRDLEMSVMYNRTTCIFSDFLHLLQHPRFPHKSHTAEKPASDEPHSGDTLPPFLNQDPPQPEQGRQWHTYVQMAFHIFHLGPPWDMGDMAAGRGSTCTRADP
jgi:hypothetical protein